MAYSIAQIAQALGADAFGAVEMMISGVAEPAMAGAGDLALAMSPKYAEGLPLGSARAARSSAAGAARQAGQAEAAEPIMADMSGYPLMNNSRVCAKVVPSCAVAIRRTSQLPGVRTTLAT
jgi:UDP-3-O-[3-hydroxymyristoyl] glucosamine N-acyltransferase